MADRRASSRRFTVAAQHDVDEIWSFTAREWSNEQADRYLDDLYDIFDLLLLHPFMARERSEIVPRVRLHPHRSHLILYRVDGDELVILRVLHMSQDWRSALQSGEPWGESDPGSSRQG